MDSPPPLVADAPGGEEVPAVAWPLLWRQRLGERIASSERSKWIVLVTVLSGLFATGFTFTIFAVSLGKVATDLHSSVTTLQWVISGPMLVYAFGMPLLGKFGDIHGHRRVYLLGFGGFIVASALTALAWNGPSLIAIRLLGAVEGAATGPASMAIILNEFAPEERVKAMGWWSLVGAGAPVIGLVAGGPIVDAFGWRWLFLVQAPLSALALAVGIVVLRETPRREREPIDVRGALALAVAVASPLLALTLGRAVSWTHPVVFVLVAAGVAGCVVFARIERGAAFPILPLDFLRRRAFAAPITALFCSNLAYMGGFIVTPVLLRGLFGKTVAETAVITLFRPLAFSLAAPVAGYVAVRVGERRTATVGAALISVSMAAFAYAVSVRSVALVVLALVVSGIGMGVASPSLQASAANAVAGDQLGVASAAQQMVSQIGAVVGITLLSTLAGAATTTGPFVRAYLAGGALAACGIVAAVAVTTTSPRRTHLRIAA
jgi:EmrB/QacA subfamily drug resistance transporter